MKIIRCFPSQEAVKGHGRSGALCRTNLWFVLSGRCFTHSTRSFADVCFTLSRPLNCLILNWMLWKMYPSRMFYLSVWMKDAGCPLWNRFCTILAHICTILLYCVKHARAWKEGMFHNMLLKINKMRDGESVKLSPGEKSLWVVQSSSLRCWSPSLRT